MRWTDAGPARWPCPLGNPLRQRSCAHLHGAGRAVIVCRVDVPLGLIEFPADDPDRARRFWSELLGTELAAHSRAEGRRWQTPNGDPLLGIHERGAGPGDTASLPYFTVPDMAVALERVTALGESVIHPRAAMGDLPGLRKEPVRPRSRVALLARRVASAAGLPRAHTVMIASPLPFASLADRRWGEARRGPTFATVHVSRPSQAL
jgi:predicted enzyme related to lactoylglutathione lyase